VLTDAPQHIRPPWQRVAARLQSVARTNGYAVVSIQVLVNQDGNPVYWLDPAVRKVEPRPKGCEDAIGAWLMSLLTPEP